MPTINNLFVFAAVGGFVIAIDNLGVPLANILLVVPVTPRALYV